MVVTRGVLSPGATVVVVDIGEAGAVVGEAGEVVGEAGGVAGVDKQKFCQLISCSTYSHTTIFLC